MERTPNKEIHATRSTEESRGLHFEMEEKFQGAARVRFEQCFIEIPIPGKLEVFQNNTVKILTI